MRSLIGISRVIRVAASLAIGALTIWSFAASPALAISVGDRLPAYRLTDLSGRSHDLSAQKGSVVLIHIFGHSAQVCTDAASKLEASFNQKYSDKGLAVFGVDCWNGSQSEVDAFRSSSGASYPLLMGGASFASECDLSYNSFLLVDQGGTVRYLSAGPSASAYDEATLTQQAEYYLNRVSLPNLATWGAIKTLYNR